MIQSVLGRIPATAARSLSLVSLHKAAQIAGMAATVTVVPRLFGAESYGRFAFILSISYMGQILGDFGTLDVLARFVPGLDRPEAGRLYMRTLAYKLVVAGVCGLLTAGAALALAGWMQPAWAILAGLGVSLRIAGWVPFQFALGLNRVGTWMAEQAWRQWVMLVLLLVLLPLLGMTGALLALVLMELLFCLLGWWWVRDYWLASEFRLDWPYLQPYLRAGLGFFLANLAAVALYRSGPALVEIFGQDSTETGYLNLALGLFLVAYITLSQFAQGLIPALSQFVAQGRPEQAELWLGNFVRYTWLLGWGAMAGVWLAADWAAPLIFGRDFGPAALSLKWISLGIPFAALLWAGNVAATVAGRGRLKFGATLAGLGIFLAAGPGLIVLSGAAGAAVGLSLAVFANVVVLGLVLRTGAGLSWWTLWPGTTLAGLSLGLLFWLS